MHRFEAGQIVVANHNYEVIASGDYDDYDLVPCRRIVDTNGATCAFLAISVLGIEQPE
jgi:hypothetical protein